MRPPTHLIDNVIQEKGKVSRNVNKVIKGFEIKPTEVCQLLIQLHLAIVLKKVFNGSSGIEVWILYVK